MNKDLVVDHYHHIDNGGVNIKVDIYGNVTFEVGFFGYSNTVLSLSNLRSSTKDPMFLDVLVEVLQKAQDELKERKTE